MNQNIKTSLGVAIIIIIAATVGFFTWKVLSNNIISNTPTQVQPIKNELAGNRPAQACPQDTKKCPDGSYVSRTGPNCEFAACPGDSTNISNQPSNSEKFQIISRNPKGTLEGINSGVIENSSDIVKGSLGKISVTFNKDVNEATLNNNTFYVLVGLDEKALGKITYDKNSRSAYIILDKPIEGGLPGQQARVTVVVSNIKDVSGSMLDEVQYNIDILK